MAYPNAPKQTRSISPDYCSTLRLPNATVYPNYFQNIIAFLLNPHSPQSHGLSKFCEIKAGVIAELLLNPCLQFHGLSKLSETKAGDIPGLLLNPFQCHGLSN